MLTRITNEKGAVSFNKQIVSDLIRIAVDTTGGTVKPVRAAQQEIFMTDAGLFVRLYATVKFGASIRSSLSAVVKRLEKDIREQLGLPIDNIEINVTAVASRKEARRSIVFDLHGRYENSEDNEQ